MLDRHVKRARVCAFDEPVELPKTPTDGGDDEDGDDASVRA